MARAQLDLNIGANGAPAKKEIKEVKKEGVNAVEEIGAKNREALKGFIGMFAPMALAIGAVMAVLGSIKQAISEAFNQGKVFQEFAEKANISANSVAMLKAQADSAGLSTKEFERAMDDLASGKTSIQMLQKEWGKLGNQIDVASKAQENFSKLARVESLEQFGEGWNTFWGGLASFGADLLGAGGDQLAAAKMAGAQGKTWEEAKWEAQLARGMFDAPIMEGRIREAYLEAFNDWKHDQYETEQRFLEETAKVLMTSGLKDEEIVRLFKEQTDRNDSIRLIQHYFERAKTKDEILKDKIKEAQEAQKKLEEEEKKQAEARKKEADDRNEFIKNLAKANLTAQQREQLFTEETGETKKNEDILKEAEALKTDKEKQAEKIKAFEDENKRIEEEAKKAEEQRVKEREEKHKNAEDLYKIRLGFRDTWTDGGGLIGNVNYGLRNQNATQEQIKLASQQLNEQKKQAKSLKEIEDAIKGDK